MHRKRSGRDVTLCRELDSRQKGLVGRSNRQRSVALVQVHERHESEEHHEAQRPEADRREGRATSRSRHSPHFVALSSRARKAQSAKRFCLPRFSPFCVLANPYSPKSQETYASLPAHSYTIGSSAGLK
eukprot:scaffold1387_cov260-Pinguiococcus_pyrenoidosus.AAC.12